MSEETPKPDNWHGSIEYNWVNVETGEYIEFRLVEGTIKVWLLNDSEGRAHKFEETHSLEEARLSALEKAAEYDEEPYYPL